MEFDLNDIEICADCYEEREIALLELGYKNVTSELSHDSIEIPF